MSVPSLDTVEAIEGSQIGPMLAPDHSAGRTSACYGLQSRRSPITEGPSAALPRRLGVWSSGETQTSSAEHGGRGQAAPTKAGAPAARLLWGLHVTPTQAVIRLPA